MLFRSLEIDARPFASAADFLEELPFLVPGIGLLDLHMERMSGLELLEEMRKRDCYWPVVMMSGHGDIALAVQAIKLGAVDFLQKPFAEEDLIAAIDHSAADLPNAILKSRQIRAERQARQTLSPREEQVLDGVVSGRTSKEIAKGLGLSPRTVESYRVTMMAKLGVQNLRELLALAQGGRALR